LVSIVVQNRDSDGAPFLSVVRPLSIVAAWGVAAFLLALRLFRWK